MEMHIDDNVTTNNVSVGDPNEGSMDEMSYSNSNDVVKDYLDTNNLLRLGEKDELEIDLLKAKKALTLKHLEIAEVELQIKKILLEKERRALAEMSQI